MDAHVFRRIAEVLTPLLAGARLEKIQSPAERVHVFTLYGMARKLHLVLRAGRQSPFLYLAAERPVTGAAPSAQVMRLRKYCAGRRVSACAVDWPARRLALLFQAPSDATGGPRPPETWLVLDLREGPQLLLGQSPAMDADIRWPQADALDAACKDWRQWPVLTPALRRILPALEPLDQAALLADLEAGGGDLFMYCAPSAHASTSAAASAAGADAAHASTSAAAADGHATAAHAASAAGADVFDGASPSAPASSVAGPASSAGAVPADVPESADITDHKAELWAWPLPESLRAGRVERVWEDPLAAVAALGGRAVLGVAADRRRAEAALPYRREAARLARLLEKLDGEETRLRAMAEAQAQAVAVQAVLWRYAPDARLAVVATDDATCPQVALDARLSLRDNMQALFHRAARGRRGLPHVQERRRVLTAQLRQAQTLAEAAAQGAPLAAAVPARRGVVGPGGVVGVDGGENRWPKGVQAFRSTDGHIILRGRDAKGNWALLRVATGHDLWLHVEGGPGSHAIIRRAFAGEPISEQTLHEAAALAAAKSWQKDSPSALILCAQVRHVKPMRGAAPGTVRIDKVEQTFRVQTDDSVEERLHMA